LVQTIGGVAIIKLLGGRAKISLRNHVFRQQLTQKKFFNKGFSLFNPFQPGN